MIRFLSTPSARRATGLPVLRRWSYKAFLSTPSARRATHSPQTLRSKSSISIHALREEGDRSASVDNRRRADFYPRPPRGGRRFVLSSRSISVIFLSTPSARRATLYNRSQQNGYSISIHALREEGDERNTGDYRLGGGHFYPRPPRGGRRQRASKSRQRASISIHALREEGDLRYGKPARAI